MDRIIDAHFWTGCAVGVCVAAILFATLELLAHVRLHEKGSTLPQTLRDFNARKEQ